jgi:hypothetical protein
MQSASFQKEAIEENIYEHVLSEKQKSKLTVRESDELAKEMENRISKFKSFVEEDYKLSLDKYQALPIEKFHVFTFKCGKHKSKTFAEALEDIPYCKWILNNSKKIREEYNSSINSLTLFLIYLQKLK